MGACTSRPQVVLTERGRDLVASSLDRDNEGYDDFPAIAPVRVFRDDQVKQHIECQYLPAG